MAALTRLWIRAGLLLTALFTTITLCFFVCWGAGVVLPYNPHLLTLFAPLPVVGVVFVSKIRHCASTRRSAEELLGEHWRIGHQFGLVLALLFGAHISLRLVSESSYVRHISAANVLLPFVPLTYVLLTTADRRAHLLRWVSALPPPPDSWRRWRVTPTWRSFGSSPPLHSSAAAHSPPCISPASSKSELACYRCGLPAPAPAAPAAPAALASRAYRGGSPSARTWWLSSARPTAATATLSTEAEERELDLDTQFDAWLHVELGRFDIAAFALLTLYWSLHATLCAS